MGSSFWRYHYVLGAGWILLAVVMVLMLQWAPLEFGIYCAFCSVVVGLYEKRLALEIGDPKSLSTDLTLIDHTGSYHKEL